MSVVPIIGTLNLCPICGSADCHTVLEMPGFPLTGIYAEDPAISYPAPDQDFRFCSRCGHGFLGTVVNPVLLYEHTYSHTTTSSPLAIGASDFLWRFLAELTAGKMLDCAVEIGCNDLYLLERLRTITRAAVGIDPIWRGKAPQHDWPNVTVLGKYVAELDPATDLPQPLDLAVAAHTIEHLANPVAELSTLVDAAAPDALFLIEVPCLDTQIANCRFDQIFHQHIQYFSLASALAMIARLGCSHVAHRYNFRFWGGTLLIAFRKGGDGVAPPGVRKPELGDIRRRLAEFRQRYACFKQEVEAFDGPLYGFGAAQMLPTIAYHLDSDMSFLSAVLDDNPSRIGRFYPGWRVPIIPSSAASDIGDAGIVVTALDSCRAILRRSIELNPRAIFPPLCTF